MPCKPFKLRIEISAQPGQFFLVAQLGGRDDFVEACGKGLVFPAVRAGRSTGDWGAWAACPPRPRRPCRRLPNPRDAPCPPAHRLRRLHRPRWCHRPFRWAADRRHLRKPAVLVVVLVLDCSVPSSSSAAIGRLIFRLRVRSRWPSISSARLLERLLVVHHIGKASEISPRARFDPARAPSPCPASAADSGTGCPVSCLAQQQAERGRAAARLRAGWRGRWDRRPAASWSRHPDCRASLRISVGAQALHTAPARPHHSRRGPAARRGIARCAAFALWCRSFSAMPSANPRASATCAAGQRCGPASAGASWCHWSGSAHRPSRPLRLRARADGARCARQQGRLN